MTATIIALPAADASGWQDTAECRGYPTDWWFPEKVDGPAGYTKARQVCAVCPVRDDCLDHALHHPERKGMWGGHTPMELRAIRRTYGIPENTDD